MARLIDADALLRAYCKEPDKGNCKECEWWGDSWCRCEIFGVRIDDQPTVDAVEVVHGRWLDNGMCNHKPARFRNPDKWTTYKCSICGYSNGRRKNANYCPNCGADMRERRTDDTRE